MKHKVLFSSFSLFSLAKLCIVSILVLVNFFSVSAQINSNDYIEPEFEPKVLNTPKKYKKLLLSSFTITEIPKYQPIAGANEVLLENGYAKYNIKNPNEWRTLMADNIPVAIDIIYTKYPRNKEDWRTDYHGLLANRLKALFKIDPSLNSVDVTWNIILQTDCYNEPQTKRLFHGIAIRYISKARKNIEDQIAADTLEQDTSLVGQLDELDNSDAADANDDTPTKPIPKKEINENEVVTEVDVVEKVKADLPDDVLAKIEGKSGDEELDILLEYLTKEDTPTPREKITPDYLKKRQRKVERFVNQYGNDKAAPIDDILSRQKDLDSALVVMDWTGSMYAFGGEVMKWHLLNFKTSGIRKFVLFNDGDGKRNFEKQIGATGGIYSQEATNIDQLLGLFEVVMKKGAGGDRQENDIEAILKGLEKFPNAKQVVLIADNNSCVRDISLITEVKVPVKVILCGYTDAIGANPHYVQLAAQTGGSLHTAEQDIEELAIDLIADQENLQLERNGKTVLNIRENCASINWWSSEPDWVTVEVGEESPQMKKVYYSIKQGKEAPDSVYRLDLATNDLAEVPNEVDLFSNLRHANFSYNNLTSIGDEVLSRTNLQSLDLKRNNIRKVSKKLFQLEDLLRIDLSFNGLRRLPKGFSRLSSLQSLNLSNNQIGKLPKDFDRLKRIVTLNLSYNQLKKLPEGYAGWRRLEWLDISNNEIEKLPYGFKSFRRLKYFNASHNQIENSPTAVISMRQLTRLDLSYNKIEKVPSGFSNLKQLTSLNISHNKVKKLHRRWGSFKKIVEMDLSYNQLSSLPTTFSRLKTLKFLNLEGNPISPKERQRIKKMLPNTVIKF